MQVPQTDWECVIDVSQFNNGGQPISWKTILPTLQSEGITRVLIRASYGSNYEDPLFRYNWTTLRGLQFPIGAYHAAVPGSTPNIDAHAQDQSAFFLRLINAVGGVQGDDWTILDLENTGGLNPTQLTLWASHWIACVDAAVRNPQNPTIFYSYVAFIAQHLSSYSTLAPRPLWIADYPGSTTLPTNAPPNVGAWTTYFGWQFTDALTLAGITGSVDESVFAIVHPTPAKPATPTLADVEAENTALRNKIANAQKALS